MNESIFMKIEHYACNGEYWAIIYDENTKQKIFLTWDELREIFDWLLEKDKDIEAKVEWRILNHRLMREKED